jgi:hypothetical protein
VTLAEPFKAQQTYIVTVSSEVEDLRRNRLQQTARIAFSTGDRIDTGMVAGRISLGEGRPAGGWTVGLFPDLDPSAFLTTDTIYPGYLATTNSDGEFDFHYLPDGEYQLLGFEDRNRNELFSVVHESYALPDRPIVVGGELLLDEVTLFSTRLDTLPPEIISAARTNDGLIQIRLSKPVSPSRLIDDPSRVTLVSMADETSTFVAAGVREPEGQETAAMTFCFPGLVEDVYRLSLELSSETPPLTYDSLRYSPPVDETAPSLVEFLPGQRPMFVNEVELGLVFSEPVDRGRIIESSIVLWEDSTRVIPLEQVWRDCFRLRLNPTELVSGRVYRLNVTEFDLVDLADNQLGDSLITYRFSTLDNDSLGSISGRLFIDLPGRASAPAALIFREAESQREFTTEVMPPQFESRQPFREFSLDVPAGKYLLRGFLDSNEDGKVTPGSLQPYRLGETQTRYDDTISVRARFETAGVELRFK